MLHLKDNQTQIRASIVSSSISCGPQIINNLLVGFLLNLASCQVKQTFKTKFLKYSIVRFLGIQF